MTDLPFTPDPEQLPLGMHEGAPLVPVEALGTTDEVLIVPVREPPVCGEWSYDDSELEEPRFAARRIDGIPVPTSKATPIHPIRVAIEPRAARAPILEGPSADPVRGRTGEHAVPRALRPTLDALRLAFEQTPGDTARVLAYVAALEKKGDADTALRALDAAAAAGADDFLLICARASALGAKLRYDEAEKAIRQAAKLRPDAVEVQLQAGVLAFRRGKWRDAVEPLRKVVATDNTIATAHYFLGEALNKTDDLAGALTSFQRAAELEPDHWRALKGVGIVFDRMGRPSEAAPYYRRARDAQRA